MTEKKTPWTPGPWFAVNVGTKKEPMMSVKAARIAGQPPRHEVAICATGDSPQEMENANARLIAAAPAMAEALEPFSRMADFWEPGKDMSEEDPAPVHGLRIGDLIRARAALALATGGTK